MASAITTATAANSSSSIPSTSSLLLDSESPHDSLYSTPVVPMIPAYKTAFVLAAPREISEKVDLFRRLHDKVCSPCSYLDDPINYSSFLRLPLGRNTLASTHNAPLPDLAFLPIHPPTTKLQRCTINTPDILSTDQTFQIPSGGGGKFWIEGVREYSSITVLFILFWRGK
jgi:hypothetical protein